MELWNAIFGGLDCPPVLFMTSTNLVGFWKGVEGLQENDIPEDKTDPMKKRIAFLAPSQHLPANGSLLTDTLIYFDILIVNGHC